MEKTRHKKPVFFYAVFDRFNVSGGSCRACRAENAKNALYI